MHVRVRFFGQPDSLIVVESKLTKIDQFRITIRDKFGVNPENQLLFYGGKLLENGYTFFDYNIKLNDVIQLMDAKKSTDSPDKDKAKIKNGECSKETPSNSHKETPKKKKYKDANSTLYVVGDFIDMKGQDNGEWLEGKIISIVLDPDMLYEGEEICEKNINNNAEQSDKTKNFPSFSKVQNEAVKITDENILYKVELDDESNGNPQFYCKLKDIRPRARKELKIDDLNPEVMVMLNHNIDYPSEKGLWYDFKVEAVKKYRKIIRLDGILYLGPYSVPQKKTKVLVHDKIFAIEQPVPVAERTEDYIHLMSEAPAKRSKPFDCLHCHDDKKKLCHECGCSVCGGKQLPDQIILCDDCDQGFHMNCLTPPITEITDEDWYCPSCKRDPNEVVAPGGSKQTKKPNSSKTKRDWGRGMACVGKTKTCAMPPNHFGPIPGIEVGMCWRFRIQLSESGVHRPPVSGIHGRDVEGAYSIVLSGGYPDDFDNGNEFIYSGSGGRDLSGNKRTAEQSCDQTLTRENKALARNCAVEGVNENGADAGEAWKHGKPVRVVRSYKMLKHFPKYAPKEGIRYDGIYKVVKYYPEKGVTGFRVWKYLLRRDDPSPAPWQKNAKKFPIVYPDGYLEAEAEKKALKEKTAKKGKRALNKSTRKSEDDSPPSKMMKTRATTKQSNRENELLNDVTKDTTNKTQKDNELTSTEKDAIESDKLNAKLWAECLEIYSKKGRKDFIDHVTEVFLCIICQDVAVNPTTTPCLHNFCMSCMKLAVKTSEALIFQCPFCRQSVDSTELEPNENLKNALCLLLAGYDAGKK